MERLVIPPEGRHLPHHCPTQALFSRGRTRTLQKGLFRAHVSCLSYSIKSSYSLFDRHRIPRQVIVYQDITKLKIKPLSPCFCAYHHLCVFLKLFNFFSFFFTS